MKPFDLRWLAAASALLLMACDGGASAVPARDHSAAPPPSAMADADPDRDARDEPVPQVDGKPMWSASRRYSAQENAERNFERNGETFGAGTVEQYVKKAHAFVGDPPKGALTLSRANGDTLIYDPKSNTFAVATKDGAPRTMFKPDDGMAYWEKQKVREAKSASRGKDKDDEAA